MIKILQEDDPCIVNNCGGKMVLTQDPCFCMATSMPPCSACENSVLACDTCGWNEDEDPQSWWAGDCNPIDWNTDPTANTVPYDESMKKLF